MGFFNDRKTPTAVAVGAEKMITTGSDYNKNTDRTNLPHAL